MRQRVLDRSATQGSKSITASEWAPYPAIPKPNLGVSVSVGAGATLHRSQRSPCYAVQDR